MGSDWIGLISAAIGLGAAIVSIVFAKKSATSAASATLRLAEAAEAANDLRKQALPERSASWSDSSWKKGSLFEIKNVGNHPAELLEVTGTPEHLAGLVSHRLQLPQTIQPGETFEFMNTAMMQGRADVLFRWENKDLTGEPVETRRSAIS